MDFLSLKKLLPTHEYGKTIKSQIPRDILKKDEP